ncbi:TPA: hypothetical protein ACSG6E_001933 [Escherichia coli]
MERHAGMPPTAIKALLEAEDAQKLAIAHEPHSDEKTRQRWKGKKGFPDRRNPFLKVLLACWLTF